MAMLGVPEARHELGDGGSRVRGISGRPGHVDLPTCPCVILRFLVAERVFIIEQGNGLVSRSATAGTTSKVLAGVGDRDCSTRKVRDEGSYWETAHLRGAFMTTVVAVCRSRLRKRQGRRATQAVVIGLVLVLGGVAAADTAPPGRLLSRYESSTTSLSRDCGFSRPLPSGKSLWLFCDTEVWKKQSSGWKQTSLIWGNTAAEGPYSAGKVPAGLIEVPPPPKRIIAGANPPPQRFQPNPTDLYVPNANPPQKCPTPLAWPNGVTPVPGSSSLLLIDFMEVCYSSQGPTVEGSELVEYDSTANKVVGGPWEVYKPTTAGAALPAPEKLGSPILSTDQKTLYFFSSNCQIVYGACSSGAVYLASVAASATAWSSAANYRFWDPISMTWVASAASAGPLFNDGGGGALAVTVNSYAGRGLELIELVDLAGGYRVWQQPSFVPTRTWTAGHSGSLPNCNGGHQTNGFFCRSLVGHPELSTSTDLLVSYFAPDEVVYPPAGHEIVVAIPW